MVANDSTKSSPGLYFTLVLSLRITVAQMDPLTTFSLACNVIQIVDFSTKVVKKCRELYKDGALSDNRLIEDMAKELTNLRSELVLPNQPTRDQLLELGIKCSDTAAELVSEIQKLKVGETRKKRQVLGKTIKGILKRNVIEDVQKRLDDYISLLDNRILIDLRKRTDLLSIQQNKRFQDLDQRVQMVITNLAQGPRNFDELKVLVSKESESVKEHITNEFRQQNIALSHENHRKNFLKSLWFPEIDRRSETIREAHEKTFQWIYRSDGFDGSDVFDKVQQSGGPDDFQKGACRWDNFVEWLEGGEGTYWINGKAGSGKSTLMSYIVQDERTLSSLRIWSGVKDILIPRFFFWNAGKELEKSSQGLLRSLIYQSLQGLSEMDPRLSRIDSSLDPGEDVHQTYGSIAIWTERRLLTTFQRVMQKAQETCRVCVFIDGLDEFAGDQDALITLIEKIQSVNIKVCLSSRPHSLYSEAFGSSAKLQLQDLTERDIRIYVSDKLQLPLQKQFAEDVAKFTNEIVKKAMGVFLWVELVVRDLVRGLRNDDSLSQLKQRLELMPSGIEDLYAHMLSKIDVVYQKEAAQLLQMALADLTGSLLDVALAVYKIFDQRPDISLEDALHLCGKTRKRIPSISAGLLEVNLRDVEISHFPPNLSSPIENDRPPKLAETYRNEVNSVVDFHHRSAIEFLEKSEEGQHFLNINTPPSFNPHIEYVKALLAKVNLVGLPEVAVQRHSYFKGPREGPRESPRDQIARALVLKIMDGMYKAEGWSASTQISIYHDIDRTLAALYQRYESPKPKVHWCTQWGLCTGQRTYELRPFGPEFGIPTLLFWPMASHKSHLNANTTDPRPPNETEADETGRVSSPRIGFDNAFHSPSGEPRTHNVWKSLPTKPVDFLGTAASCSLSRYVRKMLDLEKKPIDQDTATYLLCCTLWLMRTPDIFGIPRRTELRQGPREDSFDLITELLRRGANPNLYVEEFSSTIWGRFLEIMLPLYRSQPGEAACAMTTNAFLLHGASVHERQRREVSHYLPGFRYLKAEATLKAGADLYQHFLFLERKSVLSVIRECLWDTTEFEAMEDICLAKGGLSSTEHTHMALMEGDYWVCRISEAQYDEFMTAFQKYGINKLEGGQKQDPKVPAEVRLKWGREIARLYQVVSEGKGDSKRESSPGEKAESEPDAEGELQ